ncbi:LOW QUALITY PROTEIN: hypothetical protein CVT26_013208 [Gymnopilus dilepis]|uniref:Uncharacterized protein n=1 Tax=Gymnopilus dilepis TaxID=231916 RepID=A0A409VWI3_9AGAR|nr:LOW QUALITY PROTEIN: hypothetical protein CVT26_013208 [Gymnopilus dilepis]
MLRDIDIAIIDIYKIQAWSNSTSWAEINLPSFDNHKLRLIGLHPRAMRPLYTRKYSLQRGSPFTYEGVGRAADRLSGAIYEVSMASISRKLTSDEASDIREYNSEEASELTDGGGVGLQPRPINIDANIGQQTRYLLGRVAAQRRASITVASLAGTEIDGCGGSKDREGERKGSRETHICRQVELSNCSTEG